MTNLAGTLQIAQDTAANWQASTRVLLMGEWALETDTGLVKIGNGSALYPLLPYLVPDSPVVQPAGSAYTPTAQDFLRQAVILVGQACTLTFDSVALPAGRAFHLAVCRNTAGTVGFAQGSMALLRGSGKAIASQNDTVVVQCTGGGTIGRVLGELVTP